MSKLAIAAIAAVALGAAALGGALIAAAADDRDGATTTVVRAAPHDPDGAGARVEVGEPSVDTDDVPLGRSEARRVAEAAVIAVGGGSVTEVSRSDDPGETYEVEVLTDRGEIDVALDQNLQRVRNHAYDD
jgi:hypothetical protein